jgi:hypothetical protein
LLSIQLPFFHDNEDLFSVDGETGNLEWQHFDAGEGLKVRIIYVSDQQREIDLAGHAANTKIIVKYPQSKALNNIDLSAGTNIVHCGTFAVSIFNFILIIPNIIV